MSLFCYSTSHRWKEESDVLSPWVLFKPAQKCSYSRCWNISWHQCLLTAKHQMLPWYLPLSPTQYLTTQNAAHPDMKTIYGCSLQTSAEHSKSYFRSSCYTHLSVSTKLKLIYALSASRLSVPGFRNTHINSPPNAELSEDEKEAKLL